MQAARNPLPSDDEATAVYGKDPDKLPEAEQLA